MFQVVATDAEEGWVEIQAFGGEIEQMTDEEWRASKIEPCEAPEDWSGPYDDLERDDVGDTEANPTARDWRVPLDGKPVAPEGWDDPMPSPTSGPL